MTPIEWLESQPLEMPDSPDPMGRVMHRGGGTVFAHIKEDRCDCIRMTHDDMVGGYLFQPHLPLDASNYAFGQMDGAGLDPYDVAVKRGAPA